MPQRLVVPLEALPGKRYELIHRFQALCSEVRQEPGNEEYEVYQSVEHPGRVVLLELWSDEAALEAHLEVNRRRTAGPDLDSLRRRRRPTERYTASAT